MKVTTKSALGTEKAGEEFSKKLNPQDVVFLIGNLGSGKTTFTKGIAKGLGITSRIISPTFVLVRSHDIEKGKIKTLYHLDLYRLQNENDVLGINLTDYLEDERGLVVIEWPEVSQNIVKKKVWKVVFETKEHNRNITIIKE